MATWADLPLELRLDVLKRNADGARARWFRRRRIRLGLQLRFPKGQHDGRYMYRYVLATPLGLWMWYSFWENLGEPHRVEHHCINRYAERWASPFASPAVDE